MTPAFSTPGSLKTGLIAAAFCSLILRVWFLPLQPGDVQNNVTLILKIISRSQQSIFGVHLRLNPGTQNLSGAWSKARVSLGHVSHQRQQVIFQPRMQIFHPEKKFRPTDFKDFSSETHLVAPRGNSIMQFKGLCFSFRDVIFRKATESLMAVRGVMFMGQQDFRGRYVAVFSGLVSEAFRRGIRMEGALLAPTEPRLPQPSNGSWLRFRRKGKK